MKEDRGDNVVSSAIGEWPSSLEAVLFGTNDSTQIVDLVNAFCERALGAGIDMVTFYKRGVGAAPAGLQTFIEAATPMLTSVRLPCPSVQLASDTAVAHAARPSLRSHIRGRRMDRRASRSRPRNA